MGVDGQAMSWAKCRIHQSMLIVSVLLGSWLGMQWVHELGHILGAVATRGRVARVVLHPLTISRTDLSVNPHPLAVAWAGPLAGIGLPLSLWGIAAGFGMRGTFVLRFFAGFCLIANGAYLAIGSIDRVGDAGELLRHGSPHILLWLFGMAAVPVGLWLWHRQGQHFGLGPAGERVDAGVAYTSLGVCLLLTALGVWLGDG
jgi:hypothetical protein